jgi:hypothetical protein
MSTKKVMLQYIMQHIRRGVPVELCDVLRRVLFADPLRVRPPAADFESRPPSAYKARRACAGHPKLPHAVLVDFGCARKVPSEDLRWEMKCDPLRMGSVFGNRGHIAPELHAAWDQLRASDVVLNFSRQVRPGQRVCTHALQA